MAKIKKSFFRKYNYLLSLLLSFWGIQSCIHPINTSCEYGTPSADYEIIGIVKDSETGNAIKNIEVATDYRNANTDSLGNYKLLINDFPDNKIYLVTFKDIDGDTNGSYQDKDTLVDFKESDLGGGGADGDWYKGKAQKEITIKLNKK